MYDVSAVLMTRNQAWNLTRLIDSVVSGTDSFTQFEIVIVDAGSRDATIEVARQHSVQVVRLRPGDPLTTAGQRYAGYRLTTGDFVLFLRGDLVLCEGWLPTAVAILHASPAVAVLTGPVSRRTLAPFPRAVQAIRRPHRLLSCEHMYCYGEGLYRRSVLDQIGLVDPYFPYDDGAVLWRHIRHRGYDILGLRRHMARRHVPPASYKFAPIAGVALRLMNHIGGTASTAMDKGHDPDGPILRG
jgi:glycosyltransferase involved in cell wall biosynthesis